MIVKIPVYTIKGWVIEEFKVFDSCLYCGWIRKKWNEATYIINGKKVRGQSVKCGCRDAITVIEIIMEEILIEELEERGIVLLENY